MELRGGLTVVGPVCWGLLTAAATVGVGTQPLGSEWQLAGLVVVTLVGDAALGAVRDSPATPYRRGGSPNPELLSDPRPKIEVWY